MKRFIFILFILFAISYFIYTENVNDYIYSCIYNKEVTTTNSIDYIYSNKRVTLTFDDGPNKKYTPELLDYLKEKNIKATFFLLGENIPGREELVKRIYDEGHVICVHAYTHRLFTKMKNEKIIEDVTTTSNMIEAITGEKPKYIRPPYGSINKRVKGVLEDLNLKIILWDIDSLDWKYRNKEKVHNKVLKLLKSTNNVVLMHDSYKPTIEAVKTIVEEIENSYSFVTINNN